MRSISLVLAAVLAVLTFSNSAEAQLLNRLKKKAKAAAEQKAEEKLSEQVELAARQAVEKSWNTVFGEVSADSSFGPLPFSMNSNVETEDVYNFDTATTMEITTVRSDGQAEPPAIMEMYFNEEELYTGTRFSSEEMKQDEGDLFIIYDLKHSAMVMLMENKNDKFSFAYDWEQSLENPLSEEEEINWEEVEEWQGYTKIGTKNIQGFECDGYRSENSEGVVEVWVSRDDFFGSHHLFKANANTRKMRGTLPENYPYGTMMEMISEDRASGDKTIMKVIDVRKNVDTRYAMADYPIMSMGGH
ncbi:DUF4412 domain-containing protein [Fodinibius sediminis]|uniref:DUF4412 domain-containing protein n=1 Tax=Fodinibius sediminis TaxID=1214077 RepID=A0A521BF73_9BACT|nr:DUF4412 domain-containing protein [Fodinibius sediminis]SMO45722.1 protein of unknown function [Fodinibius sediminis]